MAQGSQSADGVLTLTGISPSTLYFSDRPQRVVGHTTTAEFVEGWPDGDNSFASDPPNAVLSFVDPGSDRPDDCVVVLRDPQTHGDSLQCRPLSPASMRGMRRRQRRR